MVFNVSINGQSSFKARNLEFNVDAFKEKVLFFSSMIVD